MAVAAIDHVQLAMPAGGGGSAPVLRRSMGIPEVPKPPKLERRGGCWFERGAVKLHLGIEKDFRPAKKAHPALLVIGPPDLAAELVGLGLEVVDDQSLEGYCRVYTADPFGNRIELMERLAT